ncbi:MAG: hypothetical protein E6I26_06010 [Chloroflexi bacterium]|nr:MAG: hypothetical protein E6I26_06010 [Chloroflexota bacterium]
MQEHPPVPSDARDPTTATAGSPFDDPRSMQILSTEHWSLLATRSLAWNESFSRAGLFLSVVSATAVALALVGQASQFGSQFTAFALVMLPVCLFVGLATFTRLDEVNGEDAIWVAGMNRIRHAYMEIGPGLAPYFISGTTDDPAGLERTFGVHRPGSAMAHWIVTMPGMVAVIDGVLAGLLAGLAVNTVSRMAMEPSIIIGAVVGVVVPVILALRSQSSIRWLMRAYRPQFPSGETPLYGYGDSGAADRGEDRPGQPSA